jgi:hypothetical protein
MATVLGCGSAPPRGDDVTQGSQRDVSTSPGDYDGYTVSTECRTQAVIGLLGRGTTWFEGAAPDSAQREAALHRMKEDVLDLLIKHVASITSVSVGLACTGTGVIAWFHDWRDIDDAITHLGAYLRARNLREEIGLGIEPPQILLQ